MTPLLEVVEYLKKYPVFNLTTVCNFIKKERNYGKVFLHRLKKRVPLYKIGRDTYSLYNDPFLIASRVLWPSYISGWSALNFHHLTNQVPQQITVISTRYRKPILFQKTKINFIKTKPQHFFGYRKVAYAGGEILVGDPEKVLLDATLFKIVSFSEVREMVLENIKNLKIAILVKYLQKIGNKTLIKRWGFLLESAGYNYYPRLKKNVNNVYQPLDYSKRAEGKKNKKWRLIINA